MKKGFTLIELLAVIIILAILMIIAVPNVLNTLNTAKSNAFKSQAQSLWKTAEQEYIIDSMTGTAPTCYDTGDLDISGGGNVTYKVTLTDGKVSSLIALDITQGFYASSTTTSEAITVVDYDSQTVGTC